MVTVLRFNTQKMQSVTRIQGFNVKPAGTQSNYWTWRRYGRREKEIWFESCLCRQSVSMDTTELRPFKITLMTRGTIWYLPVSSTHATTALWHCHIPQAFRRVKERHSCLRLTEWKHKQFQARLETYFSAAFLSSSTHVFRWRAPNARHEGIWGTGGTVPLILNLGTGLRWEFSFRRRPLYLQGKTTQYRLNRRLGGPGCERSAL